MNDQMAIILAAVLVILCISVLVFPFLKSRYHSQPENLTDGSGSIESELDAIYDAIQTLQLEHQLGKMPEAVYQEQFEAYRIQAAGLLRQQHRLQAENPDQVLEQEILAARAEINGSDVGVCTCPDCNSTLDAGVRRCPECHHELNMVGLETGGESEE